MAANFYISSFLHMLGDLTRVKAVFPARIQASLAGRVTGPASGLFA